MKRFAITYALTYVAAALLVALMLAFLAGTASAQTETPTPTPTATPPTAEQIEVAAGKFTMDYTVDLGQIFIFGALLLIAGLLVVYIPWRVVTHFLR